MSKAFELPLMGAKGEPVDFARTIVSYGVAELPPNRVDLAGRTLETTLPARRAHGADHGARQEAPHRSRGWQPCAATAADPSNPA